MAAEGSASDEAGVDATPTQAYDDSGQASTIDAARASRKVREGLVVSTGMDKTAVVATIDRVRHRRYNKTVQRTSKLFVHDEENDLNVGDRVRIQETRPLSKKKRWRIVEVLERAR